MTRWLLLLGAWKDQYKQLGGGSPGPWDNMYLCAFLHSGKHLFYFLVLITCGTAQHLLLHNSEHAGNWVQHAAAAAAAAAAAGSKFDGAATWWMWKDIF